jgi:photosystem II stability/assembly factor-like uncharacterized protein
MKNLFLFIIVLFFLDTAMAQWHWQNPYPQGYTLYSTCFPSPNIGYAVGMAGTIIKTTDGCTSWNFLSYGGFGSLFSVFFPDANTGYAIGSYGTIIQTDNGGGPV